MYFLLVVPVKCNNNFFKKPSRILASRRVQLRWTLNGDVAATTKDVSFWPLKRTTNRHTVSVCVTSCTNHISHRLGRRWSSACSLFMFWPITVNRFDRPHLPLPRRLFSTFTGGRSCSDITVITGTPLSPLRVTLTGAADTAGRTQRVVFTLKAFKLTVFPSCFRPLRRCVCCLWKRSLMIKL